MHKLFHLNKVFETLKPSCSSLPACQSLPSNNQLAFQTIKSTEVGIMALEHGFPQRLPKIVS